MKMTNMKSSLLLPEGWDKDMVVSDAGRRGRIDGQLPWLRPAGMIGGARGCIR